MQRRNERIWIPQAVAISMLAWALLPDNPYTYYTLLRWVCCSLFAFLAIAASERKKPGWVWTFALLALLYNPVARVSLEREVWVVVNLVTIVIAAISLGGLSRRDQDTRPHETPDRSSFNQP